MWIIIAAALLPGSALAFSDVPPTHPSAQAIAYVQGEGIVRGYDDGTYKPQQVINRAEFTKIIMGARFGQAEIETCLDQGFGVGFSDVSAGAWYGPAICLARKTKIVGGYANGTFKPGNTINVAEAAKILALAYGLSVPETDPWYEGPLQALGEKNAIPVSIHAPDEPLDRGEMAEMVYRLQTENASQPSTPAGVLIAEGRARAGGAEDTGYNDYGEGVIGKHPLVLFFHAAWCPFCRAHDLRIRAFVADETAVLLPIYKVDYDAATELKKQYGVTTQDTFVKVNSQGEAQATIVSPTDGALFEFLHP